MFKRLGAIVATLLSVGTIVLAAGDYRAITSLVGVTDSAASLKVLSVASTGVAGDTRAIGSLVGHTDSSGNLYVTLDPASVISGASVSTADGSCAAPSHTFTNDTTMGWLRRTSNSLAAAIGGACLYEFNASNFVLGSGQKIAWSSTSASSGTADLFLERIAANIIGQRSGANGQAFNWYGSLTDYAGVQSDTSINLNFRVTEKTPGSAPSAALAGAGAGNVDNGSHVYQETCVGASGETPPSASSGAVTVADKTVNGKVTVTLVACTALSTGRNLYRSKAGTTTPLFLVVASPVVADPATTATYTDNIADVSLQAGNPPSSNTDVNSPWKILNNGGLQAVDSTFIRDAADVLALKDGTNNQEFRLYKTTTGPNYAFFNFRDGGLTIDLNSNFGDISLGGNNARVSLMTFVPRSNGNLTMGQTALRWAQAFLGNATITTSTPLIDANQTWNAGGVAFKGASYVFTETASAATSRYIEILGGASGTTDEFYVLKGGTAAANNFQILVNSGSLSINGGGAVSLGFWTSQNAWGRLRILGDNAQSHTANYWPNISMESTFSPGSGSGSWAELEIRPTINGTSSGKATGLAIASLTNTLTGGTINLIDAGTTTTDYVTGYTQKFAVDTNGAVTAAATVTTPTLAGSGSGVSVGNVGANSCGTTTATISGTQISGVITVGATSGTQCRVTFTTAAPSKRDCTVTDSTTTIATRASYVDTTHTDFLGAFVAGDAVTYVCTVR